MLTFILQNPPLVGAFVVVALLVIWLRQKKQFNTIPGPPTNFVTNLLNRLPARPADQFKEWAETYGEIYKVRVGWSTWIVLSSREAIREILEKQSANTSSKPPAPLSHGIVTNGMRMPTMPYGRQLRAQRSVVREITSVPMTASFFPSQEFEAKQLLFDLAFKNDDQRGFYMHMRRYAFSIILTTTFGVRVQDIDHPDVHNAVRSQAILRKTLPPYFLVDAFEPLQSLPSRLWPGLAEAREAAKEVHRIKMNLWSRLHKQFDEGTAPMCYGRQIIQNEASWFKQGLTEVDLAWVAGGLVEAGFETSAATLNNLVLYLAAYPEVQTRAYAELMRVVGPTRLPTFADMKQLPYIRACVKEMLRIKPLLAPGIKHYTDREVTFKGHVIPKGTTLLMNTAYLHRDPGQFPDPEAFIPERYLDHDLDSADYAALSDPFRRDHFTFSNGRRVCPGSRVAENSMRIALANMLWAFEIRPPLVDGAEAQMDLSSAAFPNETFTVPRPFMARFVPRNEAQLEVVRDAWETAMADGYELRGVQVNVEGMVHD